MNNHTKYFSDPISLSQLRCHCGCGKDNIEYNLLTILDSLRTKYGKAININSGVRCEEHNKKVGGRKNSAHLHGLAVDIRCEDDRDRWILLDIIRAYLPIRRIGLGNGYIHIDIARDKKQDVFWDYY